MNSKKKRPKKSSKENKIKYYRKVKKKVTITKNEYKAKKIFTNNHLDLFGVSEEDFISSFVKVRENNKKKGEGLSEPEIIDVNLSKETWMYFPDTNFHKDDTHFLYNHKIDDKDDVWIKIKIKCWLSGNKGFFVSGILDMKLLVYPNGKIFITILFVCKKDICPDNYILITDLDTHIESKDKYPIPGMKNAWISFEKI